MVLYISTGYWVLGIVSLNQLKGGHHTHISYSDIVKKMLFLGQHLKEKKTLQNTQFFGFIVHLKFLVHFTILFLEC